MIAMGTYIYLVEVAAAFFAVSYIMSPICVATPFSPKTELIDNRPAFSITKSVEPSNSLEFHTQGHLVSTPVGRRLFGAMRSVEVAAAFFAVSYIMSPICVATPFSPKTELITMANVQFLIQTRCSLDSSP
jgi:hypothetical protein